MIFIFVEGPRSYGATGEKLHHHFLLVKSKFIINDTRHGWDKLKNVYKYENRDCPKFSLASQIKTFSSKAVKISFVGQVEHYCC